MRRFKVTPSTSPPMQRVPRKRPYERLAFFALVSSRSCLLSYRSPTHILQQHAEFCAAEMDCSCRPFRLCRLYRFVTLSRTLITTIFITITPFFTVGRLRRRHGLAQELLSRRATLYSQWRAQAIRVSDCVMRIRSDPYGHASTTRLRRWPRAPGRGKKQRRAASCVA